MKLRNFLINISKDELTRRLIYIDQVLHELHDHGLYVVGDLADIEIINDEITMESFKGKYDYLNSGYNINGDRKNILELCSMGICAYNNMPVLHTSKEFINYVIENVEMYLEYGNIPKIIQEYYITIFSDLDNFCYLNDFIERKQIESENNGRGHGHGAYTKSTAVGRALSDKENSAFVSIMILPAILTLLYVSIIVIYFIFLK